MGLGEAAAEATLRAFLRRAIEEEEPSQLTGAPLHSSLDSVRRRIEATETRLIDLVASSHADVDATLALGEHVAHEIGALRAGMDAVSHDELQHRVHGVVVSRGRMRDELASARRVRDTLQLLCDMHDAVSRFDAALARGDICEGSNALHSMTSQLSALRASASLATSPRLLDMLQKKTISAQAELSASASAAWDGVARVETAEKGGGACSSPAAGAGCELILVGSGVDGAVDPSIVLALRRTQRLKASLAQLSRNIAADLLPCLAVARGGRLKLRRQGLGGGGCEGAADCGSQAGLHGSREGGGGGSGGGGGGGMGDSGSGGGEGKAGDCGVGVAAAFTAGRGAVHAAGGAVSGSTELPAGGAAVNAGAVNVLTPLPPTQSDAAAGGVCWRLQVEIPPAGRGVGGDTAWGGGGEVGALLPPLSPGAQVRSPGGQVQSPGVEVHSPGTEMQSPRSEVQSPGSEVQSPTAEEPIGLARRSVEHLNAEGLLSAEAFAAEVERACDGLVELGVALRGFFVGESPPMHGAGRGGTEQRAGGGGSTPHGFSVGVDLLWTGAEPGGCTGGGACSGGDTGGGGAEGALLLRCVGEAIWGDVRGLLLDGTILPLLQRQMASGLAAMAAEEAMAEAGGQADVGNGARVMAGAGGQPPPPLSATAAAARVILAGRLADELLTQARVALMQSLAGVSRTIGGDVAAPPHPPGSPLHPSTPTASHATLPAGPSAPVTATPTPTTPTCTAPTAAAAAGIPPPGISPSGTPPPPGTPPRDELVESLQLGRCRVSGRVLRLERLCVRALQAAVLSGPEGAVLLVRRAREMVELFLAVAPTRMPKPMVPHVALMLHNDCRYLSHACLLLALPYFWRLPEGARAEASLVEFAEPLRAAGKAALERAVESQTSSLLATLDRAGPLSSVGEDELAGSLAQRAAAQLARELAALRTTWCDALPASAALPCAARMAEAIMGALYHKLIELRHISERDSRALHRLLSYLLPACEELLSASARAPLGPRAEHLVPSLRRCRQVAWILDARLAQVVDRHTAGGLDGLPPRHLLLLTRALWTEEALLANARSMHAQLVAEASAGDARVSLRRG